MTRRSSCPPSACLAANINVGDHVQRKLFGLTVDLDTFGPPPPPWSS